jgi:integrase
LKDGSTLSPGGINKALVRAKIAAGWHTFRHTFATLLKANGEDVKTVQEN